jgi:hypothetical protein
MTCNNEIDVHIDSGYRRVTGTAERGDTATVPSEPPEIKGYGIRGLCLLRRGVGRDKKQVVHLLESVCKSHRLTIRSRFGADLLAAAHGMDDVYSTVITLAELKHGCFNASKLKSVRESGGLALKVTLTTDAEGVYKSLTGYDLKAPAEKTLLGHIWWLRELIKIGVITAVQLCDTRDMTADGHTKGRVLRDGLLEVMQGRQTYRHDLKRHTPQKPK